METDEDSWCQSETVGDRERQRETCDTVGYKGRKWEREGDRGIQKETV